MATQAVPGTVVPTGAQVGPAGAFGPQGATGPGGPTAVSTDAGNQAVLGSDSKIYVPTIPIHTRDVNGLAPGFSQRMQIHDDCSYPITGNVSASALITVRPIPWYFSTNGGFINQSTSGLDQYNKCYGCFGLVANAVNTYAVLTPPSATLVAGLGALDLYFRVAFGSLPTAANPCSYNVGISDGVATANNAIHLDLVWTGSVTAWRGNCTSGGTITSTPSPATSPPPLVFSSTALTFFTLHVSINAAWNLATFYVNGVNIGSAAGIFSIPRTVYFWIYSNAGAGASPISTLVVDDVVVDYQYAMP